MPMIWPGPGRYLNLARDHVTRVNVPQSQIPYGTSVYSPTNLQGTQVTESENHVEWGRRQNLPFGDVGGSFTTRRKYATSPVGVVHLDSGWLNGSPNDGRVIYDGPLYIDEAFDPTKVSFPGSAESSDAQLQAFGTTAIARCAPTRPTVNLAASLLETYHEGLPKLIGKDTWEERTQQALDIRSKAKSGASEFLNYQFGWLPLVADVQDFVKSVCLMDKLLQQYIRDNGQVVRRRYVFTPVISSSSTVLSPIAYPGGGTNMGSFLDFNKSPKARVLRHRQTTINRWFSGAFVYHLPWSFFAEVYNPFAAKFQVFRKILGLDLTPEVLWELTPWSWAVDWFTNVGDMISNASTWANDGLVLKYGYIMEHSIVHDTISFEGPCNFRYWNTTARPPNIDLVVETKLRRAASPFGFGLTTGGLTNLQKSILASVGLSRLK